MNFRGSRLGFWFLRQPTPPPPVPTVIPADYLVITYQFLDGQDLDMRMRIKYGSNQSGYIGWAALDGIRVPEQLAEWGGDNTRTGYEAVLIYLNNMKSKYGNITVQADCRAWWFSILGVKPVALSVIAYQGGAMVKGSNFNWTNPTATRTYATVSTSKIIKNINFGGVAKSVSVNGDLCETVGTVTFNIGTNTLTVS